MQDNNKQNKSTFAPLLVFTEQEVLEPQNKLGLDTKRFFGSKTYSAEEITTISRKHTEDNILYLETWRNYVDHDNQFLNAPFKNNSENQHLDESFKRTINTHFEALNVSDSVKNAAIAFAHQGSNDAPGFSDTGYYGVNEYLKEFYSIELPHAVSGIKLIDLENKDLLVEEAISFKEVYDSEKYILNPEESNYPGMTDRSPLIRLITYYKITEQSDQMVKFSIEQSRLELNIDAPIEFKVHLLKKMQQLLAGKLTPNNFQHYAYELLLEILESNKIKKSIKEEILTNDWQEALVTYNCKDLLWILSGICQYTHTLETWSSITNYQLFQIIQGTPGLKKLILRNYNSLSANLERIPNLINNISRFCKKIEFLKIIDQTDISELRIEKIENLLQIEIEATNIEAFIVSNCPKLTKVSFKNIASVKILKLELKEPLALDLSSNIAGTLVELHLEHQTLKDLSFLAKKNTLKQLSLKNCELPEVLEIDASALQQLEIVNCSRIRKIKLTNSTLLKKLILKSANLYELDLSHCEELDLANSDIECPQVKVLSLPKKLNSYELRPQWRPKFLNLQELRTTGENRQTELYKPKATTRSNTVYFPTISGGFPIIGLK